MSVWCTVWSTTADDHGHDCGRWVPCSCDDPFGHKRAIISDGAHSAYDARQGCTCNCGPLAYQRSHVVPRVGHPRAGAVDVATVASHIGPDGQDREVEDGAETHVPFLRLSLDGSWAEPGTVVLDAEQVRGLRDACTWFLGRVDRPELRVGDARPAGLEVHDDEDVELEGDL